MPECECAGFDSRPHTSVCVVHAAKLKLNQQVMASCVRAGDPSSSSAGRQRAKALAAAEAAEAAAAVAAVRESGSNAPGSAMGSGEWEWESYDQLL